MTEREAFIRGIAENLYDDTPRLAFADWLDEHGEHDRAEFIRVQVELEPMRDQYEIPRAAELHAREEHFGSRKWSQHGPASEWLGQMPTDWGSNRNGMSIEFRRGFPDLLRGSARAFLQFGPAVMASYPTIRRVVIHCLNGWGERLAACEGLDGLAELELACWYADDDMKALAASPHLATLRVLEVWTGRQVEGTDDATLCHLTAKGEAWPNLRELVLLDPAGKNETRIKKFAASVNRSAKRKLARYERGYPELFPLAPDFSYGSPGRLPDGRLAFACAIRRNEPNEEPFCGWEVLTFDPDGTRRKKVLHVPLPPELLPADGLASYEFEGQRQAVLIERIGFVPAFIRVQEGALGDFGPHCGHYDNWDTNGYPDDPEHPADYSGSHPNGFGGGIYWLIRNGEFVVGYDAWADKTGRVHST